MSRQNIEYRLKGLEKLSEEDKAQLQRRLVELKQEIGDKYAAIDAESAVPREQVLEACYHEILRTAAWEFNLVLLGFYERQ